MRKFVFAAILLGVGSFFAPEQIKTPLALGVAASALLGYIVTIVRS